MVIDIRMYTKVMIGYFYVSIAGAPCEKQYYRSSMRRLQLCLIHRVYGSRLTPQCELPASKPVCGGGLVTSSGKLGKNLDKETFICNFKVCIDLKNIIRTIEV